MGPEPHDRRGAAGAQYVVTLPGKCDLRDRSKHYIIGRQIAAVGKEDEQWPNAAPAAGDAADRCRRRAHQGNHGEGRRPITGVRVGVKNGGCAGMAYTMEYATQIGPYDEVVEDKGVRILIDPKAVMFLLGTEMDYKTDKLATQFVFNNPNQTSACGCGESVQLTPAAGARGEPLSRGACARLRKAAQ